MPVESSDMVENTVKADPFEDIRRCSDGGGGIMRGIGDCVKGTRGDEGFEPE